MAKQGALINRRQRLERDYWIDRPTSYVQDMDEETYLRHERQHTKFVRANATSLILQFLTTRIPANEEMLYYVIDPVLRDSKPQNSVDRVHEHILALNQGQIY